MGTSGGTHETHGHGSRGSHGSRGARRTHSVHRPHGTHGSHGAHGTLVARPRCAHHRTAKRCGFQACSVASHFPQNSSILTQTLCSSGRQGRSVAAMGHVTRKAVRRRGPLSRGCSRSCRSSSWRSPFQYRHKSVASFSLYASHSAEGSQRRSNSPARAMSL